MSTDDGHIARLWVLIVKWSVLLDSKLEFIVLAAAVPPGYSRICDVVSVCSWTLKSDMLSCE
jgi:hypothetical protein